MDLTFYADDNGTTQPILGIIDHGSRLMTRLQVVVNKKAWTLLGHLCLAIGQYGKPHAIRTDNEKIFTSFVFHTLLTLAGIKQKTTGLRPMAERQGRGLFRNPQTSIASFDYSKCKRPGGCAF